MTTSPDTPMTDLITRFKELESAAAGKWVLFVDKGQPIAIMPAGKAGTVLTFGTIPTLDTAKGIVESHNMLPDIIKAVEFAADNDPDEAYSLGKREGYSDAIQELDMKTGGDGEYKGSTLFGQTVDVDVMRDRIIARFENAAKTLAERNPGWRDIASAPKDGTKILVYDEMAEAWIVAQWRNETWVCSWDHDKLHEVSAWMPLPAAPGETPAPDPIITRLERENAELRAALGEMIAENPICSRPIGGEGSPARRAQERQRVAMEHARTAFDNSKGEQADDIA